MSRKSLPWFKCFPEDWLDDTRHLTPLQRGLYIDVLCLIYKTDDQLPDDDVWIGHKLHVKVRTWKPVKTALITAKKIVVQNGLITNSRASREVLARALAQSAKSVAATDREAKKRDASETGNKNNGAGPQPCSACGKDPCGCLPGNGHHARVARASASESRSQRVNIDHDHSTHGSDDDRAGLQPRRISSSIRTALQERAGVERARELMEEYLASDYAKNARILDRAFLGWLKKTYDIVIDPRGSAVRLGEVLALCGVDKYGRPDLTLPKIVRPREGGSR